MTPVHVRQRTRTDCGVACIAMLTGKPYETVAAATRELTRKRHYKTTTAQVQKLLEKFGYYNKPRLHPLRRLTQLPLGVPVLVKALPPGRRSGNWHWLVATRLDEDLVMVNDPEERDTMRVTQYGWNLTSFLPKIGT